jgi:thiol:disulfide interchange protein
MHRGASMNHTRNWALALLLAVFATGTITSITLLAERQQSTLPSAPTLLAMARDTAAIDDRIVMVRFRASWCEWCARLEAALHSFELGRIVADDYVLVSLTVQESENKIALETPGAQEMMDAAGAGNAGLPFYLFMDSEGTWIADSRVMPNDGNIGYPVTPQEIEAFEGLIERTAPRMTEAERALIAEHLVDHAPEF